MSETIGRTWPEELLAEGELRARREDLRIVIEKRFGMVPEAMAERIEQIDEIQQLRGALLRVLDIQDLSELQL